MQQNISISIRILLALSIIVIPLLGTQPTAYAAAPSSQIDAVLALDVSNSMKESDRNKLANEAMKMFIDMLSPTGDKVGIVAYTDRIEREKALLDIKSEADKQDLKQFIDQINHGAYTDIAVGVKEAVKVLENGADPAHEPMIVLLADGNNYLNKNGSRTQAQSDQELNQAVADAKKMGIPIYTIGLNADGQLNKSVLDQIASKTGGKSFVTDSADDLPQILSEIFASHLKLKVVPIDSITSNGKYQDVKINVPNANVLEANISIMSEKPVEVRLIDPTGNSVPIPSADVLQSKSKSYSLLKLMQPEQGDWTLQVKGVAKDKIDINLIFNYDLALTMKPIPSKSYKPGDTIDIESYLISNGQPLDNKELYNNMKAVALLKDIDTGKSVEVPLNNKGDRFTGEVSIKDKHLYELIVKAEDKSFYRETKPVQIDAKSGKVTTPPPTESGDSPEDKPFPTLLVVGGVLGAAALAAAAFFIMKAMKQANRAFVGQLVIEIKDENTGEKSYPQYKKLNGFRGKFTLHQVLQLAPELKETDKIVFTPSNQDRIMIRSNGDSTIEKSGRAVQASNGVELKNGDRITVPLASVDKTIMIEYLV
ncbi:vWA domain-containing protein [Paenibacillus assamensis]|uniref:vWA domain-containing protein n=1 Tax=Paenibacillus assamensis TaxID=311244 RepID=UPI0004037248|nr:vWA domain-containing protein [Paenibacillus assamensis]